MPRVTNHLVLRTIDGATDLLIEELRPMSSIHSIRQSSVDTVECTLDGLLDELISCALYSTIAVRDLEDGSITEIGSMAWTRRFGWVERLPWSTNLIVAEVLVRLAKIRPGHQVLDPFCGTGTILRAVRRREPGAFAVGTDHDPKALDLAARNLSGTLSQAAAEALPFATSSVDRVVANLPFGKQVGSHRGNRTLYPAALDELDRILSGDGRAVLLTEDKRLLRTAIERQGGLKVVRQRLLKYNGATPTAYVLARTRPARTTASSTGDR
ncbi:TRM11 family SAM-dependent methyltransferase [Kribbella sindirgiensis]|uniref:Methyltransferase domain-containing protein n=1 Tax=Kribbella sindirgiensis TaxID=1124744 RepID=A0A4R0I4Q7_9ACTN|nr:methyltransferase domain-containing protein [Kribbella sindirgiensis]TCC18610.1 methyltransferase domain-containing protein [Kribbella sindirgiensis]